MGLAWLTRSMAGGMTVAFVFFFVFGHRGNVFVDILQSRAVFLLVGFFQHGFVTGFSHRFHHKLREGQRLCQIR